jgi:hypothetical protein
MIHQSLLDSVIHQAERHPLDDELLANLRGAFPGVHFTCCMDDDIVCNARPVFQCAGFNVYLVNTNSHCSVLTNDLDVASGIVLAQVIED